MRFVRGLLSSVIDVGIVVAIRHWWVLTLAHCGPSRALLGGARTFSDIVERDFMDTSFFLKMLMVSLGMIGVGILLLGAYKYLYENYKTKLAARGVGCAWLLIALGVGILVLTVRIPCLGAISSNGHPAVAPSDEQSPVLATPQGTPTIPPPILEPGWSFHEYPDSGFGIALPDTWVKVDMSGRNN